MNVLVKIPLIGIVFLNTTFWAQENLIPNSSFENYSVCPSSTSQLIYANNWVFVGASTDYFNECSPQGNMSVPFNIYGYQKAFDGNAYIGMIVYAVGDYQNESVYREPAGTYLTEPLIIGQKYFLSFKVVLTLNDFESGGASNKIGAKLSTVAYSDSYPTPVDNFAQVYSDSIIIDTLNWTTISGSFIADSAYTFISLGNFFDSTQLSYLDFNGLWYTETAYYYFDDVRLSTDSIFVFSNLMEDSQYNNFNIYFNSMSNNIQINQIQNSPYDLLIYNAIGQIIFEETNITTETKTIDTTTFNKGLLILKIKSKDQTKNYKLLKL